MKSVVNKTMKDTYTVGHSFIDCRKKALLLFAFEIIYKYTHTYIYPTYVGFMHFYMMYTLIHKYCV